jgi:hypothetical protein
MSAEVANMVRGAGRVIAVNDQYKIAPWADVLYAADFQWWHEHEAARSFAGTKVTLSVACGYDEVLLLKTGDAWGVSEKRDTLNTCRNSGHQAMNLAYLYGATRLVLCGFDMRVVAGQEHWFGNHPVGLGSPVPHLRDFATRMNRAIRDWDRLGVEVINTTPYSALEFPFKPLEKVLESLSTHS